MTELWFDIVKKQERTFVIESYSTEDEPMEDIELNTFLTAKELEINEEELKEKPKLTCVVGLTTEPERLVDIRKNRMNTLKETENTNYTNIKKIEKEISEAKKTFIKYKWPTIDVTRKSVEETAASIIKIQEIYKNNEK